MADPSQRCCRGCRHWREGGSRFVREVRGGVVESRPVEAVGECRRGPPPRDFAWPKTAAGDGCGDWEGPATEAGGPGDDFTLAAGEVPAAKKKTKRKG